MSKKITLTATDATTGKVYTRTTARPYAICRVERVDSAVATARRDEAHRATIATRTSYADGYEATARILDARAQGVEPDPADLDLLRSTRRTGGNAYTIACRNELEVLEVHIRRGEVATPADYRRWASTGRDTVARSAEALKAGPVPATDLSVTWHSRLDLAERVAQIDSRSTVVYLPVTRPG